MKAVIYARVSTEQQDTERQQIELTKLANKEGYTEIKFFEDKITGASDAKSRTGFEDMLAYIEANDINQIYCWELSRLGRSMWNVYQIIQEFRAKKINIHILKENLNTGISDANTDFQLNMLSSVAQYERDTIKKRTISGMQNSIRKGGSGTNPIKQFGYIKKDGKLIVDDDEAATIRDICNKYLNENWSAEQIANYLNNAGIETKMKKCGIINKSKPSKLLWKDATVIHLLHKKLLTGYRVFGKVEYQDEALRIIDNATYDAIQAKIILRNKNLANATKYENIFKGVLICGNCGSPMVMHKGRSKTMNHYKCYNKFKNNSEKGECNSAMIDIDLLVNKVYNVTKNFKVDSKDIVAKIAELENQIAHNITSINQIQADLDSINIKEDKLAGLYINGQIKLNIYENQLKTINEEIVINQNKKVKLDLSNIKLQEEITELSNKKIVDLSNPLIFKSNIKNLVESIEVHTLTQEDLNNYQNREGFTDTIKKFTSNVAAEVRRMNKTEEVVFKDLIDMWKTGINSKNKVYEVKIKMFDNKTTYNPIFNNKKLDEYLVTVEEL